MKPEYETKTALLTGGTSGVGLSILQALVKAENFVYFVGTNRERGQQVERELTVGGKARTRFVELDLSHLPAVRQFIHDFQSDVETLDALVNVAGVMLPRREETEDGFEKTWAVDHLSAFLLSRELQPLLARGHHPRIVNVSGPPAQVLKPQLDFDDLALKAKYSFVRAVVNALHAKTVMTEILAEHFREDGIDVNAFHPGPVKTELGRQMSFPVSVALRLAQVFMPSHSKTGIYAATSSELNGVSGHLVVGTRPLPLNFSSEYKERLWRATEDMVDRALSKK